MSMATPTGAFANRRSFELAKKYHVKTAWGTDNLFDAAAVALSGPRNPYPGRLGVVQPSALADLLLMDGDPLQDLSLLGDPEKNLLVVMKDGMMYKQDSTVTAAQA